MYEFFAGGAVVLGGNGTENQGGCLIGTVAEQGIRAFARPSASDVIHIESEDFGTIEIEIGDTDPKAEEAETPAALVRGIMNCFIESGNVFGGFNARIFSDIPSESGISYSSAFAVLIGKIISGLYFENTVPAIRIAEFAKAAETDYFGRPCGVFEKLVSALDGTVFADFSDPEMPQFCKICFDFAKSGYTAAMVDFGAKSAEDNLEAEKDLGFAAWNMGHTVLSEGDEVELIALYPILKERCGERAALRALYFYEETRRAEEEAAALEKGDFSKFLKNYKESAASFEEKFGIGEEYKAAFDLARGFFGEEGAAKISGENKKSLLAILPEKFAADFAEEAEKQGFGVMFVL